MQKKVTAAELVKAEMDRLAQESAEVPAAEPKVSDLDILRHRLAIAGQSVRSLFYLQPGKHARAGLTKNHMRPRNKKRAQMAKHSRRMNRVK